MNRWGSCSEAAEAYGVKPRTLRDWAKAGKVRSRPTGVRRDLEYEMPARVEPFQGGGEDIDTSGMSRVPAPIELPPEQAFMRPRPDRVERHLIISDPHLGGGEDPFAWNCALKSIAAVRPTRIILLGDVVDLESMSSHAKLGRAVYLEDELASANRKLDHLANLAGDIPVTVLEGNHEDRMYRFVSQRAPQLLGAIKTISELLEVRERGWEWIPFRQLWLPFEGSPVGYTHGAWHSKHCAHAALGKYSFIHSVRFGHVHRSQSHVVGHHSGARFVKGVATPTCRSISWDSVKYTQGPPDWVHGIGVDEISPCGAHSMVNYEMTDRRLLVGGVVVDGRRG